MLGLTVVGVRAIRTVRHLQSTGATVRPLAHDVDLPGRFPPRWLVVLGDSAAAGHGVSDADAALARRLGHALVAEDGRATAVCSVAVDGATTADVLATQVEAARGAEVVVLGVGVNDAVHPGRSLDGAAVTLRTLLDQVRAAALPDARIVLLSCPDLSRAPGLPAILRPWVGRRCRSLAARQAAVASDLDIRVVSADRTHVSRELFGADGFHPGDLGHAELAVRVLAALAA